jgi:hypothetical protein
VYPALYFGIKQGHYAMPLHAAPEWLTGLR